MASINASGHKFGLVYPGVGWCIFRSKAFLPESLVFHDNYLGTDQISFTLNFSKGASQMRAQPGVVLQGPQVPQMLHYVSRVCKPAL